MVVVVVVSAAVVAVAFGASGAADVVTIRKAAVAHVPVVVAVTFTVQLAITCASDLAFRASQSLPSLGSNFGYLKAFLVSRRDPLTVGSSTSTKQSDGHGGRFWDCMTLWKGPYNCAQCNSSCFCYGYCRYVPTE